MPPRLAPALLIGLLALVYAPVATLGFASDDLGLVLENPATADLANVPGLFLRGLWAGVDAAEVTYYRPTMVLSLAVDRALWGLSPVGHHLHSLAWHLAATAAVLAFLTPRVGADRALLGAGIFGFHPVQSEVVAWVSGRNDALAVALGVGAAVVLDARARAVGAGRHVALAAATALAFLALCSKETALAAGVGWLVLDRSGTRAERLARAGAVGLASVAFLALRAAALGGAAPPSDGGWALLAAKPLAVAGHYASVLVRPWPLSDAVTLVYLDPAPPWLALALVTAGAALLARRGGVFAVAALVFAVLVFLPVVPAVVSKKVLAERYLYFPMVGIAAAAAAAAPRHRAVWAGAAGLAVAAVALVGLRLPAWESSLTLAEASAAATPTPYAHGWLAVERARTGDGAGARAAFAGAMAGTPPYCPSAPRVVQTSLVRPAEAVALGRSAYDAGCAGVTGFREAWALAHVLAGDTATADRIFTPRPAPCDATASAEHVATLLLLDGPAAAEACARATADPAAVLARARAFAAAAPAAGATTPGGAP